MRIDAHLDRSRRHSTLGPLRQRVPREYLEVQGTLGVLFTEYPQSTIGAIPLCEYAFRPGHSKSTLTREYPTGTLIRRAL